MLLFISFRWFLIFNENKKKLKEEKKSKKEAKKKMKCSACGATEIDKSVRSQRYNSHEETKRIRAVCASLLIEREGN